MNRWWDAEEPSLGLTSDDVVHLLAGDDPTYDLGAALFTLHRAGARACLHAAEQPLVDDRTLITSMGTAREQFAPPVVAAVSKALGDDRVAGLLVRDVADDAELGAVQLFRQAVAKGVAPPLAAERAALVYGVPADCLGSYRALACTPTVQPVALKDAADRVLFAYLGAVVESESGAVAKADYLEEHNVGQDRRGQFVRLKDSGELAQILRAKQDPTKLAEILRGKSEPEQREHRQARQRRLQRSTRSQRTTPAAEPRAKERSKTRSKARTKDTRLAQLAKQNRVKLAAKPGPAGDPDRFDSVMAQIPDSNTYHRLDLDEGKAISVFLSPQEATALDTAAYDAGDQFRIGHVLAHADVTVTTLGEASARNQDSSDAILGVLHRTDTDSEMPYTLHVPDSYDIDPDSLTYEQRRVMMNPDLGKQVLAEQVLADLGMSPSHPQFSRTLHTIANQVAVYQDRTGNGVHYVYAPGGAVDTVNELRVWEHDEVRGSVEGGRRTLHLTLDPNQVYTFEENENPDSSDNFDVTETWDANTNTRVIVHSIRPKSWYGGDDPYTFDDPVGKADSPYLDSHNVTQDQLGRFIREKAVADVLREAQGRIERTQRQSRQQRTTRTTREVTLQPVRAKERSTERDRARAKMRNKTRLDRIRQKTRELAVQPEELGSGEHVVLSGEQWADLRTALDHTHETTSQPSVVILNPTWATHLRNKPGRDSHQALAGITAAHHYHAVEMAAEDQDAKLTEEPISLAHGDDEYRARQVLRILGVYMEANPQLTDFAVELEDRGVDIGMTIYGVRNEYPPVVLTNTVQDWDAPVRLRRVSGKKHPSEENSPLPTAPQRSTDERPAGALPEPQVETYTRPFHERYVIENYSPGHKPGSRG